MSWRSTKYFSKILNPSTLEGKGVHAMVEKISNVLDYLKVNRTLYNLKKQNHSQKEQYLYTSVNHVFF